ncbi:MAG: hypothetical protein IJ860_06590 [Eubacterium sp.]|nr:hypothetical protein [Eubacterium sp.]
MKKRWTLFAVMLLMGLLYICFPVSAKAAVTLKELKPNKTYKKYDITRDGEADRIRYKHSDSDSYMEKGTYEMRIYVNGKKVATSFSSRGGSLYYCKLNKKNEFLIEQIHYAGGACDYLVHAWKNGKIRSVSSGMTSVQGFYLNGTLKRTSDKKKLYIESCQKFNALESFPDTAPDVLKIRHYYQPKSGKLKLVSRAGTVVGSPKFVTDQSFSTSKSVSKPDIKNGVQVQGGETVTLKKICFAKGGSYFYYIKTKNGAGWFEDSAAITLR